ncbi:nucleotidyltransferase family protein [Thermoflexibacter ruber]|uniref:dTDP-glucose pyrophosphorylase n=1 Tax=Thermoflexibacter ruber TaxID=1003 RepID=A0A1I2GSU6_9BACT|nr:sugar phosphate nucleotidyltransferase [Thermoflexibacter ruber]SFF20542.1 dTDP-glucose pyrophosphorylase [Thermoflexibacter ruber]
MKPTLLILAAGVGSRYGGLKQIDSIGVNGATILEYSIYDALRAGFGKIVLLIRRSIEQDFKAVFSEKFKNLPLQYAFQENDMLPPDLVHLGTARQKPWGTAHAVWCARYAIQEPFTVINADDFYGASAFQVIAKELEKVDNQSNEYCMVGYYLKNTLSESGSVARGVCSADKQGYLTTVVERTDIQQTEKGIVCNLQAEPIYLTGNELVSMNFWGFTPTFFDHAEKMFTDFLKDNAENPKAEFFIPLVVNHLIQHQLVKVKVLSSKDEWIGVTYSADKESASKKIHELVAQGKYPSKLF